MAPLQNLRDGSARVLSLINCIGELLTSAFTGTRLACHLRSSIGDVS
jgi:hypothetical protein